MELSQKQEQKASNRLAELLRKVDASQHVRAIMRLSGGNRPEDAGEADDLRPSQFSSRAEYRRALIDRRDRNVRDDISDTLEKLRDLSLRPHSGFSGWTILVEGEAEDLAESLELPGVESAELDADVSMD